MAGSLDDSNDSTVASISALRASTDDSFEPLTITCASARAVAPAPTRDASF